MLPPVALLRRGGREVECAALEMRFTGNRNVGSNPTLSANISMRINEMGLKGPENFQLPRHFADCD